MQVTRAAAIWLEYHRSHSRENTLKSYQAALATFLDQFAERRIGEISTEDVLSFFTPGTRAKNHRPGEFATLTSRPFSTSSGTIWTRTSGIRATPRQ